MAAFPDIDFIGRVYPNSIPSLKSHHPELPDVLHLGPPWLKSVVLNREIVAGQPLRQRDLIDAEEVSQLFKAFANAQDPVFTPAMAESACTRLQAVQSAHANAKLYPPGNFDQRFKSYRVALQDMCDQLKNQGEEFNRRMDERRIHYERLRDKQRENCQEFYRRCCITKFEKSG